MRIFISVLAVVAVLFTSGMASANLMVKEVDVSPSRIVGISASLNGSAYNGGAYAGLYNLEYYYTTPTAGPTMKTSGFCVDPAYSDKNYQEYRMEAVSAGTMYAAAAYLLDKYGKSNPILAQIATWELVWDWNTSRNLSTDNFRLTSGLSSAEETTVINMVNEARSNSLSSDSLKTYALLVSPPVGTHYGINYQDYIVRNPVPIPGAAWLLGSGLLGLIGIRRRFVK